MSRRAAAPIVFASLMTIFCLGGCESPPKSTPRSQAQPQETRPVQMEITPSSPSGGSKTISNVPYARARGDLAWGPDAILCRAAPQAMPQVQVTASAVGGGETASGGDPQQNGAGGSRPDVVLAGDAQQNGVGAGRPEGVLFAAIGPVTNLRCDSVYDPRADRMITFHSPVRFKYLDGLLALDVADDEPVSATITERFIRDVRGIANYTGPIDKSRFPAPPSGWCTWYFYYQDLNEQEVVKNAEWLAKHLKPYGLEYVQIDDAWQGVGKGLGENRDWETIDARFPHGMRWLADQIHAQGFKAGLWLAPHGQSNRAFVDTCNDAFLWRTNGASVGEDAENPEDIKKFSWEGRYIVDTSGPAGQSYMRRLFERLSREWDYDYFKIDGQPIVQKLYEEHRGRFDNPDMSPAEAYRAGLRVIREAIGPSRYLLGCWGTPWWGVGIMNGSRTGGDVWVTWEGIKPALNCTWESYWSHNLVWYADPDCLCVRSPLTLGQARAWASLMALTGQALMASDKMYELPDERVELLRRVFPAANARPMDLYPMKQPDVLCLKINDAAGVRDIVGAFNWNAHAREMVITPEDLGLPGGDYLVYDVWEKRLLGRLDRGMSATMEPTSCRVFCIRPIEGGKPTLIGTSRHVTQGNVDLEKYEAKGSRIAGRSRVIGGEPYEIRFFLQPGALPFILTKPKAEGAEIALRTEGPIGTVTLTSAESRSVDWSVLYAIPGGGKAGAPEAAVVRAEPIDKSFAVRVSWDAVASAAGYRVYRDDLPVARTNDTSYVDNGVQPGATPAYRVVVVNWQGQDGKSSESVRAEVPQATDRYLDEIPALSVEQQWGTMRAAQSVEGKPLQIAGQVYEHGIGTHAKSVIRYSLAGAFARFTAMAGVDSETAGRGSVKFIVVADGSTLFESPVVNGDQPAVLVDVNISGRRVLELRVEDAGDGNDHDHADWADARLLIGG